MRMWVYMWRERDKLVAAGVCCYVQVHIRPQASMHWLHAGALVLAMYFGCNQQALLDDYYTEHGMLHHALPPSRPLGRMAARPPARRLPRLTAPHEGVVACWRLAVDGSLSSARGRRLHLHESPSNINNRSTSGCGGDQLERLQVHRAFLELRLRGRGAAHAPKAAA